MKTWTIVLMLLFLFCTGVVVAITTFTEYQNRRAQQANIVYPFSAQLAPPGGEWTVNQSSNNVGVGNHPEDGLYLVGMAGGQSANVPQIQCPVGYKINIAGAFLDVIDPYNECSTSANGNLKLSCGIGDDLTNAGTCTTGDDSTCAAGMTCYSGKCVPKTCSTNSDCAGSYIGACDERYGNPCSGDTDCSTDGSLKCVGGTCLVDPGVSSCMACVDGYCSTMPLCANTTNGLNDICSPSPEAGGDAFFCRPRDATAYLAKHCDGKRECLGTPDDKWLPNTPDGPFGPLPCYIPAKSDDPNYAKLPIVTGWAGGAPNGGSEAAPTTFSQGYYVHGVYTCVPDDENALTS